MDDDQNPYDVYVQCRDCADWSFFVGSIETHGQATRNRNCEHCGSSRLDPQSVTSKRTFNWERAKRRKVV